MRIILPKIKKRIAVYRVSDPNGDTKRIRTYNEKQISNYCYPLNFKSVLFLYPQCSSIGATDFFFEK